MCEMNRRGVAQKRGSRPHGTSMGLSAAGGSCASESIMPHT